MLIYILTIRVDCLAQEDVILRISTDKCSVNNGEEFVVATFIKNDTNQEITVCRKAISIDLYNKEGQLYLWDSDEQYEVLIDIWPNDKDFVTIKPFQEIEMRREKFLFTRDTEGFKIRHGLLSYIDPGNQKTIFIKSEYKLSDMQIKYVHNRDDLPKLHMGDLYSNSVQIMLE